MTEQTKNTAQPRRPYHKPELSNLGKVSEFVRTMEGSGSDGGLFTDDTAS